jgi:DnaK suppressor protein
MRKEATMHRTEAENTNMQVGARHDDVRERLVARQHQLLSDIRNSVRDARDAGSRREPHAVRLDDPAEVEPDDDLSFALIHIKGETLARVEEAVRRCDEGTYGYCLDCGDVIASTRLRAIPFAVRCRTCEEALETARRRERVRVPRPMFRLDSLS